MQYILPNKLLWYIAIANVFVYLLRYGILDWSPTYLKEVKHFALDKSSWAYFLYEYAGIPGTLLCGWMSDKVFKGNRAPPACSYDPGDHRHCRLLAEPAGQSGRRYGLYDHHWLPDRRPGDADWSACPRAGAEKSRRDRRGLHRPVRLISGGSVAASAIVGYTVDFFGWDGGFMVMIGGSVLAVILLVIVMLGERRHHQQLKQA